MADDNLIDPQPVDEELPADNLAAEEAPPALAVPVGTPAPLGKNSRGGGNQWVKQVVPAPGTASALQAVDAATGEIEGAREQLSDRQGEVAEQKARSLEDQGVQGQLDALEAQDQQVEHAQRLENARRKASEAEDRYANHKFYDYFSEERGRGVGDLIQAKLARAFGAVGAAFGNGHNEVADQIQHAIDRDMDMQKAEMLSKKQLAEWRREGVTDLSARFRDEEGALKIKQAKLKEAAAAKAEAQAIRSGVPVQEAQNNLVSKQLRASAAHDRLLALEKMAGSVSTTLVAPGTPARAAGGSGKGGHGAGLSELLKMKEEGAKDSAIALRAAQLGIPVKTWQGPVQAVQRGQQAEKRGVLQDDRTMTNKLERFSSDTGLPKLTSSQLKLERVQSMLKSGNSVGAMSALLEYDAAAKGGTATESSMHALMGRMGGSWDRMVGWMNKGETGNFGPEQIKVLSDAVNVALNDVKESAKKVHNAFGSGFDYSDPRVTNWAAAHFGPLGYRKQGADGGHPDLPPGAISGTMNGKRGYVLNGEFHPL